MTPSIEAAGAFTSTAETSGSAPGWVSPRHLSTIQELRIDPLRLLRYGALMSNSHEEVQAEVRALLKEQGLRATAQRLAVLMTLHEQRAPMTHDEVMSSLSEGLYDKASVWRVLSDLYGAGLLRRMDLGDRVWRYELHDACRSVSDDHPHFLCESCSEVTCLPPLEVRSRDGEVPAALLQADFHIRITGTCARCLTA